MLEELYDDVVDDPSAKPTATQLTEISFSAAPSSGPLEAAGSPCKGASSQMPAKAKTAVGSLGIAGASQTREESRRALPAEQNRGEAGDTMVSQPPSGVPLWRNGKFSFAEGSEPSPRPFGCAEETPEASAVLEVALDSEDGTGEVMRQDGGHSVAETEVVEYSPEPKATPAKEAVEEEVWGGIGQQNDAVKAKLLAEAQMDAEEGATQPLEEEAATQLPVPDEAAVEAGETEEAPDEPGTPQLACDPDSSDDDDDMVKATQLPPKPAADSEESQRRPLSEVRAKPSPLDAAGKSPAKLNEEENAPPTLAETDTEVFSGEGECCPFCELRPGNQAALDAHLEAEHADEMEAQRDALSEMQEAVEKKQRREARRDPHERLYEPAASDAVLSGMVGGLVDLYYDTGATGWYRGRVMEQGQGEHSGTLLVQFEDKDTAWLSLEEWRWRIPHRDEAGELPKCRNQSASPGAKSSSKSKNRAHKGGEESDEDAPLSKLVRSPSPASPGKVMAGIAVVSTFPEPTRFGKPKRIALLKEMEDAGATILKDLPAFRRTLAAHARSGARGAGKVNRIILLCERPVSTVKYVAAMAAGIPVLHVEWAVHCLAAQKAPFESHESQASWQPPPGLLPIDRYAIDVGSRPDGQDGTQPRPVGVSPTCPLGKQLEVVPLFAGWKMFVSVNELRKDAAAYRTEVEALLVVAGAEICAKAPTPGPKRAVLTDKPSNSESHTLQWVNDHLFLRKKPSPDDTVPSSQRLKQRKAELESWAGQRPACDESLVGRCLMLTSHNDDNHVGLVQEYCPETGDHEVLYPDGELQLHTLSEEPWSLWSIPDAVMHQRHPNNWPGPNKRPQQLASPTPFPHRCDSLHSASRSVAASAEKEHWKEKSPAPAAGNKVGGLLGGVVSPSVTFGHDKPPQVEEAFGEAGTQMSICASEMPFAADRRPTKRKVIEEEEEEEQEEEEEDEEDEEEGDEEEDFGHIRPASQVVLSQQDAAPAPGTLPEIGDAIEVWWNKERIVSATRQPYRKPGAWFAGEVKGFAYPSSGCRAYFIEYDDGDEAEEELNGEEDWRHADPAREVERQTLLREAQRRSPKRARPEDGGYEDEDDEPSLTDQELAAAAQHAGEEEEEEEEAEKKEESSEGSRRRRSPRDQKGSRKEERNRKRAAAEMVAEDTPEEIKARKDYSRSPAKLVGKELLIHYDDGAAGWYRGTVKEYNVGLEELTMLFDDGSQEQVNLGQWEWRLAIPPKLSKKQKQAPAAVVADDGGMQPPVSCARVSRPLAVGKPPAAPVSAPALTKSPGGGSAKSTASKYFNGGSTGSAPVGKWELCGPGLRDDAGTSRYEAFAAGPDFAVRMGDFVNTEENFVGRVDYGYASSDGSLRCVVRKYVLASDTRYGAEKPASELFLAVMGAEEAEEPVIMDMDLSAIQGLASVQYTPAKDPAPIGLAAGHLFCRNGFNEDTQKLTLVG